MTLRRTPAMSTLASRLRLVDDLDHLPWNRQAHARPSRSPPVRLLYQGCERPNGLRNVRLRRRRVILDYHAFGSLAERRRRRPEPAGIVARHDGARSFRDVARCQGSAAAPPRSGRCAPTRARDAELPASHCYLLDADDDLADEFDLRMRLAARQVVTAAVFETPVGECDLDAVVRGAGARARAARARRRARRRRRGSATGPRPSCVGAGDLLQRVRARRRRHPRAQLRPGARCGRAAGACSTRTSPSASRPWPQITQRAAAAGRPARRPISTCCARSPSQPRLEVRLVLLLWHLAARWGRVEPAGIRALACRSRTGCSASSSAPSGRRSRTRWRGSSRAGLVTGQRRRPAPARQLEDHLAAPDRALAHEPSPTRPARRLPAGDRADAASVSSRRRSGATERGSSTSSG